MMKVVWVWIICTSVAYALVWRADVKSLASEPTGEMQQVGQVLYSPLRIVGGSCVALGGKWVLTCRHGTETWDKKWLRVAFPAFSKERFRIEKIYFPPTGDVALLELKKTVPQAAQLAIFRGKVRKGQRVWMGGFGMSGPVGKVRKPGRFYMGHNRVDGMRVGKISLSMSRPEAEDVEPDECLLAICDSGSPLFVQVSGEWQLAGIGSTASSRFGPSYGDRCAYARVSEVAGWLLSVVQSTQKN